MLLRLLSLPIDKYEAEVLKVEDLYSGYRVSIISNGYNTFFITKHHNQETNTYYKIGEKIKLYGYYEFENLKVISTADMIYSPTD